jgi:hypothetical protein
MDELLKLGFITIIGTLAVWGGYLVCEGIFDLGRNQGGKGPWRPA